MRFQVTQVMDAIEQRLTTDIACAQAVVDLADVVRRVDLDGGRPVNLVRVGMVVDALSRYLVDGGAMLYGVAERSLLSEGAFTSKERMVLSRWADDGQIEVVPQARDRAAEVADLTGLPLILLEPGSLPARFGWPDGGAGRVLWLTPRCGAVVLTPLPEPAPPPDGVRAVGRAAVKPRASAQGDGRPAGQPRQPESQAVGAEAEAAEVEAETEATETRAAETQATEHEAAEPEVAAATKPTATESDAAESDPPESDAAESDPAEGEPIGDSGDHGATGGGDQSATGEGNGRVTQAAAGDDARPAVPLPVAVFGGRGAPPPARVRISRHRFLRAAPNPARASLLARAWRCDSVDCAAFGDQRLFGQPVPALRGDTPVCPRHGQPLGDAGPRPVAYPVSIVVDDLPRRRLVVRAEKPVVIGRADDDPDVFSVQPWLHRAAASWISASHLRLAAGPDGLSLTDLSTRGTVVWRRSGPDSPRRAEPLHHATCVLGEWDSIELYTGIEVVRGDYRPATVLGPQEPASVLMDAPTAAHRTVAAGSGKAKPAGTRAGLR